MCDYCPSTARGISLELEALPVLFLSKINVVSKKWNKTWGLSLTEKNSRVLYKQKNHFHLHDCNQWDRAYLNIKYCDDNKPRSSLLLTNTFFKVLTCSPHTVYAVRKDI